MEHVDNYHSNQSITFVVPSIAEMLMNKMSLRISIDANYWTAKRAIIASNDSYQLLHHNGTARGKVFYIVNELRLVKLSDISEKTHSVKHQAM